MLEWKPIMDRIDTGAARPRVLVTLTRSEAETIEVGRRLGAELAPGSVVLLVGELGTGKTAFVRGLAAGVGADPDEVSSPTFTLVQEYAGRLRLYHVDLYRLSSPEVDDLGLEELIHGDAVVAVEWADRWSAWPPGSVRVTLEDLGGDERRVTVTW
jgi:tRNA threonylcarbamoyladenosine biosynthesis protein TsaE